MFFSHYGAEVNSHYGAEVNEQLVRQAGFDIEQAAVISQDNEDGRFLWVVARLVA